MGKIQLQKFEILLSGNKNVYHLGEQVIGKCIIAIGGELQLSMIHMKLKGKAKVQFSKGSGRSRTTYSNKIKYLEMDYNFVRNTFNGLITKGFHEFPFCYQLPNDGIPSSFVGSHGSVKYWIEAEIEKPMFSLNHRTKIEFKVEVPLICDNLMLPLTGSLETKFGCFSLNSGNIRVDINVDKKGYIPGQSISLSCKITNNSSTYVTPRATLKQTQAYVAKGQSTSEETKYLRVEGTPVNRNSTDVQFFRVPIPADVQLSLGCSILSVTYLLHMTIEIASARNLHLDVPIIITTENVLANPYSVEVNQWINKFR